MRKHLDIPLTLILTLMLTIAMLWPINQPISAPKGSDKLFHFVAFALLAFPLARTGRFGILPVFISASAFGASIELIQPNFNRSAEVKDLAADILGALVGIGCGLFYRHLSKH